MIGVLLYAQQAAPTSPLVYNWVKDSYWIYGYVSDFDIKYKNGTTTYYDAGWFPIFNVDGGQNVTILGKNNGTAYSNNIHVKTVLSQPLGENYLLIQWILSNNGTKSRKVSLSSYTDISIAGNDYADVFWYGGLQNKRGLTMKDTKYTNYSLTLLTKDAYSVTNVDTFWFGECELLKMHYWDNRTSDSD